MQAGVPKKAIQYIFFEIWPSLLMGLGVFLFILMMTQAIRYTEFVLIHGVGLETVLELFGFLCISFLPALLPMSLLFAVLMTYSRFSQDSEIVAMKASGLSMVSIAFPSLLLSVLITFISAKTSFQISPWGNRQFELLITKLAETKAGATIREGTFSEGFFDLVIYAQKVDSQNGDLSKVFIYDERSEGVPLTIISKTGKIIQNKLDQGNSVLLRLEAGDIHRKGENHTKIKFDTFDIRLFDSIKHENREKSIPSLTIGEVQNKLDRTDINTDDRRSLSVEFHKRWALSIVCVIFGMLGVALGVRPNQRSQKSGSIVVCLGAVIAYWVIYISCEGMGRSGQVPVALAVWLPNVIFSAFTAWSLRKVWD